MPPSADLFPFLASGQELMARGHRVTVAAHGIHQATIEQAGVNFADASGIPEPADRDAFTVWAFDRWRGPRFVMHDLAAMDVQASYEKLTPVVLAAGRSVSSGPAHAAGSIGPIFPLARSAAAGLAWPGDAQVKGFARYAQTVELDGPLRAFLDAYPAPLVFTLGSTAVHRGSGLLHESLAAALQLKQRAVRFTGSKEHAAASAVSIVERLLPG